MKFSEYVYQRPDLDQVKGQLDALMTQFETSDSVDTQCKVIDEVNRIRKNVDTMASLASIRNTIDTTDPFYEKEQEYFDESMPVYEGIIVEWGKRLIVSPFRKELEERYGSYWFEKIELQLKTFRQEIIEDLVVENKLSTRYSKLMAGAKIDFEGGIRNLSQMTPFVESSNRETRRLAQLAIAQFLESNEQEIDDIYDQLVRVRHKIALALGFENYVALGYARLGRTDYDSKMVANYRKQVYEDLVPLAQQLIERQRIRLGYDSLKYYDIAYKFNSGNPKPQGNKEELVQFAHKMYSEMSNETKTFFEFMMEHELLDLEAKPGKRGGGYCTYIADYQSPFIFSNFNGTSGDVDVLTHEAGHAFQVFQSRHFEIPEYLWPTYEACEIHSMSMEFFAWPWMNLFFGEAEAKYKFTHLSEALLFIPYGVTVDEFQHFVYENPEATPAMRKAKWREIEKKYLPHKIYEGNDCFERGCFWFRQSHIFSVPFYYIDYTLAQVCAFQYFLRSRENKQEAWKSYLDLCQLGGSKAFLGLVEAAHLDNPFVDGTVAKITSKISKILDTMDDSNM